MEHYTLAVKRVRSTLIREEHSQIHFQHHSNLIKRNPGYCSKFYFLWEFSRRENKTEKQTKKKAKKDAVASRLLQSAVAMTCWGLRGRQPPPPPPPLKLQNMLFSEAFPYCLSITFFHWRCTSLPRGIHGKSTPRLCQLSLTIHHTEL